jgi:hypothetical protein
VTLAISILGAAFVGFLALFWLTPVGVPALRRMGGGAASPDLRFGYRPDETYRLFDTYGAKGLAHWRRMLWLDMVFPGVYGGLFALLGLEWTRWAHAAPAWTALAVACPLAAGASDYIENVLLLRVVGALPARRDGAVKAASVFTRAKFILSHVTLATPLVWWIATRVF